MAKTITISDGEKTYTLEFTRNTVASMERQGFVAEDVSKKPVSMLPTLFAGAFMAHHKFVKKDVIDKLYAKMGKKDELISKLVEMYNEPLTALLEEPDPESSEGNVTWTAEW